MFLACLGSNVTEEEVRVAEDKFEESKSSAETAMHNLLEAEVGRSHTGHMYLLFLNVYSFS